MFQGEFKLVYPEGVGVFGEVAGETLTLSRSEGDKGGGV